MILSELWRVRITRVRSWILKDSRSKIIIIIARWIRRRIIIISSWLIHLCWMRVSRIILSCRISRWVKIILTLIGSSSKVRMWRICSSICRRLRVLKGIDLILAICPLLEVLRVLIKVGYKVKIMDFRIKLVMKIHFSTLVMKLLSINSKS